MVCAFFKQGQCSKGDKCKFSHDIALDRKGEKRSIYVDARDADEDLKNGNHNRDADDKCTCNLSINSDLYKYCIQPKFFPFVVGVGRGLVQWVGGGIL